MLFFVTLLLSQPPAAENPAAGRQESIRAEYRADAEKYEFFADSEHQQRMELAAKPIMHWDNDDDWSGDVFIWTRAGLPAVIGCILSGPSGDRDRLLFHEFHLLSENSLALVDLQTHSRWRPAKGLVRMLVAGAPQPAATAAARLTQMRQLSREFTAYMEADGMWELRLLTQPLFRYGDERSDIIDGALFTYVWTRGTDPEVLLLLECRRTEQGPAWHFAPVQFTNRAAWLKHNGREVWRIPVHEEPAGSTTMIYTTAYARTFTLAAEPAEGKLDADPSSLKNK